MKAEAMGSGISGTRAGGVAGRQSAVSGDSFLMMMQAVSLAQLQKSQETPRLNNAPQEAVAVQGSELLDQKEGETLQQWLAFSTVTISSAVSKETIGDVKELTAAAEQKGALDDPYFALLLQQKEQLSPAGEELVHLILAALLGGDATGKREQEFSRWLAELEMLTSKPAVKTVELNLPLPTEGNDEANLSGKLEGKGQTEEQVAAVKMEQALQKPLPQHVIAQIVQQVLEQLPQQILDQLPQQFTEQLTQHVSGHLAYAEALITQLTKQIFDFLPQQILEQVPQQALEHLPQNVLDQLPQQLINQVTQQVPEQFSQVPGQLSQAEAVIIQLTKQILAQLPQQVLEQLPQQVPEQLAQQVLGQSLHAEPLIAQLTKQILDQLPQQIQEQLPQQALDQLPQLVLEQLPQQLVEKLPQQVIEQLPQQVLPQPVQHVPEPLPLQKMEQLPEQFLERVVALAQSAEEISVLEKQLGAVTLISNKGLSPQATALMASYLQEGKPFSELPPALLATLREYLEGMELSPDGESGEKARPFEALLTRVNKFLNTLLGTGREETGGMTGQFDKFVLEQQFKKAGQSANPDPLSVLSESDSARFSATVNSRSEVSAGIRNFAPSTTPFQPNEVMAQVMERLAMLSRPGVQEMRLRLHPEHLGNIQIKLRNVKGVLSAEILTQHTAVKELLEGQLDTLRQRFQDLDMQVDEFRVLVGDEGENRHGETEDRNIASGMRGFASLKQDGSEQPDMLEIPQQIQGEHRIDYLV